MIVKVYAIRDLKGEMFTQPLFQLNAGTALRSFSDMVKGADSKIAAHPEDYALYEIGEYDDISGALKALTTIKMLGVGSDYSVKES